MFNILELFFEVSVEMVFVTGVKRELIYISEMGPIM